MSRSQSEHRDTCDCWQCVDSGDRPDPVETLFAEIVKRIDDLPVEHAYDTSGWGDDFIRVEHIEKLDIWLRTRLGYDLR
jgi:hypothetical protein